VLDGSFALSVLVRGTEAPHTFVVRDEATLARLRAALGGGHDGTGTVAWPTQRDPIESVVLGTVITIFMFVAYLALLAQVPLGWAALVPMLAWPFLKAFPRRPTALQSIDLQEKGVSYRGALQAFYPYADIANASYDTGSKTIVLASHDGKRVYLPSARVGRMHSQIVAAQINAAVLRARGARTPKDDARERATLLMRGSEEPVKAWLARLEALAAGLSGADYRGAALSKDDLLLVASDPDATFEQRAGAARVLVKALGPEERVRANEALANARADETNVRVALEDDLDAAADAIEEESVAARR
jgi:hypothetical protein